MSRTYRVFTAVAQLFFTFTLALAISCVAYVVGVPGLFAAPSDLETAKSNLSRSVPALRSKNDLLQQHPPILTSKGAYSPDWARRVDNLEQQLDMMLRIVPEVRETKPFEESLRKDATAAGVRIRDIVVTAPVPREFYSEESFHVALDGDYDSISRWFARLAHEDRIADVTSFSLRPGSGKMVAGECVVRTYFLGQR